LSFRPEDRAENIRRIGEMVKLFVDAGIIVLTAFISPYRKDRRMVRSLCGYGQFLEIHVDCPVEECAKRDKKGIYEKAKAGIIKNFTGISAPYEPPFTPELVIKSHKEDAKALAARVIELMEEYKIIPPRKIVGNGQSKVG
jgi:adenylylsulfate kinase